MLAAVTVARRAQLSETTGAQGSDSESAFTYTVSGYFLPRHYARFTRNYPDIRIELNELPRAAIEEGLKDGTLDIAVMLVSNLEDRERIATAALAAGRAPAAPSGYDRLRGRLGSALHHVDGR